MHILSREILIFACFKTTQLESFFFYLRFFQCIAVGFLDFFISFDEKILKKLMRNESNLDFC
jgi:hypothetical protein